MPLSQLIPQLRSAFRLSSIPTASIQGIENNLDQIASSWPEHLHPYSYSHVAPHLIWAPTTFFSIRIFLHRHNLSPMSSQEERANAIAACTAAAHATTRIIHRSLLAPPDSSHLSAPRTSPPWESRVRAMTPSHLCTHLWRCTLLLGLALDFSAALDCVRLSAAIDSLRKVNQACGRHLTAFLERLAHRLRTTPLAGMPLAQQRQRLAADEEMLAIVSADLQADTHNSWIWAAGAERQSGDVAIADSPEQRDAETGSTGSRPSSGGGGGGTGFSAAGTGDDLDDAEWGGWGRVEAMLRELAREQQSSAGSASGPSVGSGFSGGAPPPQHAAGSGGPLSPSSGSQRISIANIM